MLDEVFVILNFLGFRKLHNQNRDETTGTNGERKISRWRWHDAPDAQGARRTAARAKCHLNTHCKKLKRAMMW
eukprot:1160634-Pelagomonas_calceolata.AAC.10